MKNIGLLNNRFLKVVIVALVILLAFWFIYKILNESGDKLDFSQIHFNLGYLALSAIILLVSWWWGAFLWSLIIRKLGIELPLAKSYVATMLPQLGVYIPLKVWTFVGGMYFNYKFGVSKSICALGFVIQQLTYIIAGIIVSVATVPLLLGKSIPYFYLSISFVLMLIFIHPKSLQLLIRFSERILKIRQEEKVVSQLKIKDTLFIVLGQMVYWFFFGVAFIFIARGIDIDITGIKSQLASSFIISKTLGYISILTPGGFGVQEIGIAFFLKEIISPASLVILIIFVRFWFIIVQLIGVAIAALMYRFVKIRKEI
jgi:uncharacterized membrane protein YbhN (UPF0104 family)